ncbi:MAG: hypothetical protein K6G30_04430 [Acetatifactor sp.]|nr:hypothetical protein [Acetatifactor sp.]
MTVAEQYALIAMNGVELGKKNVLIRRKKNCILAAYELDEILKIEDESEKEERFHQRIKELSKLSAKEREKRVDVVVNKLVAEGKLEVISALMDSDLYMEEAGVTSKQYRAEKSVFLATTEYLRAEILEEGEISEEVLCLTWLLKQSDEWNTIFSISEKENAESRILKLCLENSFAKNLFMERIGVFGADFYGFLSYIRGRMLYTQFGIGLVSRMPVLARREAVFIATDSYFTNAAERTQFVKEKLEKKGHFCEVKQMGKVSLLEIDNAFYELVPDMDHRVFGVRLRRYML